MTIFSHRKCALCGVRDIPRGMDWPVWREGRPVHILCVVIEQEKAASVSAGGEGKGVAPVQGDAGGTGTK